MEKFDKDKHSDGCSMSPDGDWIDCCAEHDKAYFYGGTYEQRVASDKRLRECIQFRGIMKGGLMMPLYGLLGWIYWIGVRIGGVPFIPTPYRWGYGQDF